MEITTTETVPGSDIEEVLGVARGNTVKARNVGRDITQSLRNVTGGELKSYSSLMSEAREEALDRMRQDAEELGADAVVNVRFDSAEVVSKGAEIIAYGTAVSLD
ncbi:YbjQ family protein [Natronoarchaeum rubrum]|uniref:YbjQ family protein n=1 Tax=Natronoarchaeum rubrum TaxID=755311 RepID=UPI0021114338|nr:YbjQ family protein [Natronoarchaeum rubrum]